MRSALAFLAVYTASLLPTSAALDFPLAIGGHGTAFLNASVPLANTRIWVEVLAEHGWTNTSFTNTTEVRVDNKGDYELEAVVGDARRRVSIKGIRLYIESLPLQGFWCWHRDEDLEYMYLHQPGRKPQRQFNFDIMMFGPKPHGEATELQPGLTRDECFHRRLAVYLSGRILCNETVPMVNAAVVLVVNRTSEGPLAIDLGLPDNEGGYDGAAVVGAVTRRSEIRDLLLTVTNTCDETNPLANFTACTRIPLDYMYAYEDDNDYLPRKFVFHILMDATDHTCEGTEDAIGEL